MQLRQLLFVTIFSVAFGAGLAKIVVGPAPAASFDMSASQVICTPANRTCY
ncbi:MAG: hypothetical protein AAF141_15260 [Pseudomonadota bacterium]